MIPFLKNFKLPEPLDPKEPDIIRAKEINREVQAIACKATKRRDKARKSTRNTLAELGKTKLSIMAGSIHAFVENFSRIRNIELQDNSKIEEQDNFKNDFRELEKASFNATELMSGGAGLIAITTIAIATGAYGAVRALATASTYTGIYALSSAVAPNATLAWLNDDFPMATSFGGMAMEIMVFGGFIVKPFVILPIPLFAYGQADKVLNEVKEQRDEANKYSQDTENLCTVIEAVIARSNQIKTLLKSLDDKFKLAVNDMISITDERGYDWNDYSQNEKNIIGGTIQLAQILKFLMDIPLLTEDGKLRDEEIQVILTKGQKFLNTSN